MISRPTRTVTFPFPSPEPDIPDLHMPSDVSSSPDCILAEDDLMELISEAGLLLPAPSTSIPTGWLLQFFPFLRADFFNLSEPLRTLSAPHYPRHDPPG